MHPCGWIVDVDESLAMHLFGDELHFAKPLSLPPIAECDAGQIEHAAFSSPASSRVERTVHPGEGGRSLRRDATSSEQETMTMQLKGIMRRLYDAGFPSQASGPLILWPNDKV
jgi:hypothetical protein